MNAQQIMYHWVKNKGLYLPAMWKIGNGELSFVADTSAASIEPSDIESVIGCMFIRSYFRCDSSRVPSARDRLSAVEMAAGELGKLHIDYFTLADIRVPDRREELCMENPPTGGKPVSYVIAVGVNPFVKKK